MSIIIQKISIDCIFFGKNFLLRKEKIEQMFKDPNEISGDDVIEFLCFSMLKMIKDMVENKIVSIFAMIVQFDCDIL